MTNLAFVSRQRHWSSPLEVSGDAPGLQGLVLSRGLDPALGDDPGVVGPFLGGLVVPRLQN